MRSSALAVLLVSLPGIVMGGCSRGTPGSAADSARSDAIPPAVVHDRSPAAPDPAPQLGDAQEIDFEQSFEAITRQIAAQYKSWRRISDEADWALADCTARPPSGVLHSASDDSATHGRKLYFLFASRPEAYRYADDLPDQPASGIEAVQPVGQVLVKEAWRPVACDPPAEIPTDDPRERTTPENFVRHAGQWYRSGESAGLFIMFKVRPDVAGADKGWVYATTDATSGQMLQAGRIDHCMKCHEKAPFDRVFGSLRARSDRERRQASP